MSTAQDRDQRGGLGLYRIETNFPDPEMKVFKVACQLWERTLEGGRSIYVEEKDNSRGIGGRTARLTDFS
jgi:hypothetical protein